jgi:predicted RNase H-like nuclease (RuvC/YqgF family)
MAFNPLQFKQKKKRAVDPNAPPRPNLMSHDKTIREQKEAFAILEDKIIKQQEEIERLRYNYSRMQQSVDQILGFLRSKEK